MHSAVERQTYAALVYSLEAYQYDWATISFESAYAIPIGDLVMNLLPFKTVIQVEAQAWRVADKQDNKYLVRAIDPTEALQRIYTDTLSQFKLKGILEH